MAHLPMIRHVSTLDVLVEVAHATPYLKLFLSRVSCAVLSHLRYASSTSKPYKMPLNIVLSVSEDMQYSASRRTPTVTRLALMNLFCGHIALFLHSVERYCK